MVKKMKYVHIFNYGSMGFTVDLIKLLESDDMCSDIMDHVFVVRQKELFNKLQVLFTNLNIVHDEDKHSLINKYAKQSQWVFVHGFMSVQEIFFVKREYLHKLIWRTWGSDSWCRIREGQPIRNMARRIINHLRAYRISKISLIGLGSELDRFDMGMFIQKTKMMRIPYSMEKFDALAKLPANLRSDSLCIMIGHSGFENDHHMEMIDFFSKYVNEDVCFYFPLVYGDSSYITRVEEYALSKLGCKAIFIKERMDYECYASLLSKMDLAVFYGEKSYALGNISILSFFKRWLLLNPEGVLGKAFGAMGIPFLRCCEVQNMSFEELKKKLRTDNECEVVLSPLDYDSVMGIWHSVFDYLNN